MLPLLALKHLNIGNFDKVTDYACVKIHIYRVKHTYLSLCSIKPFLHHVTQSII